HFVFTGIDAEPEIVSESGIEKSKRMRESQIGQKIDPVSFAVSDARGRPFPNTIDSQHGSAFEWGREECGRGVGFVMLREDDRVLILKLSPNGVLDPDFLFHPNRDCFQK